MIKQPTTVSDIDKLIADQVQEDLHLDYKDSGAIHKTKKDDISKDVSAFANSDGGLIIYGVRETNFLPTTKNGIDHAQYKREWLEQVIWSNISPIVDDVAVVQIPLSSAESIYTVSVPKSFRGPHQASDKRYYRRYNSTSVPMEDYEIRDVRNRQSILPPLVNVDIEIEHGFLVYLSITNIGSQTAEDVTFTWSPSLKPWIDSQGPNLFTRGLKYLPPNRNYRLMYDGINEALAPENENPSAFDILATYKHPQTGQRVTDSFHIDLMDYWNTSVLHSELYDHGTKIKEAIDKATSEINKLNSHVDYIKNISGPTGLDLSVSSLKNLQHIAQGRNQIERMDPRVWDYRVFMEVLGVDASMAMRLRSFFRSRDEKKDLRTIEGMSDGLLEQIATYFRLEESPSAMPKRSGSTATTRLLPIGMLVAGALLIAKLLKRPDNTHTKVL